MEYPLLQRTTAYYTTAQFSMLVFARFIWSSGNRLIGFVGALGGWLITVLARRRWASAITLGDVVLYAGSKLVPILPTYVLEAAWQWIRTGDGYRNNRFEVTLCSETL